MTGNEDVYAGFCASFVYFVMGRPGMQVTTRGGSESIRLAASVALDGPNALADAAVRVVEGVRLGGGGGCWGWGGWDSWDSWGSCWGCDKSLVIIGPAVFKRNEEGG